MCHHANASMRGHYQRHPYFQRWANRWTENQGQAPVNVRETKDWYELAVYAPGLNKDAFQLNVTDDVLSIRFQASSDNSTEQWLHREYQQRGAFERRFQLNGKVDTQAISARYTNGVLEVTLPKAAGAEGQNIDIA